MHDFQAGTIVESDESAGKLFCRVVVNWVDYPTEVFPVELTNLIDISDPNGNMFNLHKTSFVAHLVSRGTLVGFLIFINIHKSDLFTIII